MSLCPKVWLVSASLVSSLLLFSAFSSAQVGRTEQVQVNPPLLRVTDPPAADASVADLENRADQLRMQKLYLDALDYYRAALAKTPRSASLVNKIGITELMMQRYRGEEVIRAGGQDG